MVTVDSKALKRAGAVALACAANPKLRAAYASVLIEPLDRGHVRFVTTDGHQLAIADIPFADDPLPRNYVVAVAGFKEFIASVRPARGRSVDLAPVVESLPEAEYQRFPDYRRILPKEHAYEAAVPIEWLAEAIGPKPQKGTAYVWDFAATEAGALTSQRRNITLGTEEPETFAPIRPLDNAIDQATAPPGAFGTIALNAALSFGWLSKLKAAGCTALLVMPSAPTRHSKIGQMPVDIVGMTPDARYRIVQMPMHIAR